MSFLEPAQGPVAARTVIGLFLAASLISCSSCTSLDTQAPSQAPPTLAPFQPATLFSPQSQIAIQPVHLQDDLQPQARFIVKFNRQPGLTDLGRTFRQNPEAARRQYQNWAQNYRALRGLVLVGASFSGELILALPPADPHERTATDVLSEISQIPSLIYIERDSDSFGHSGGPK